MNINDGQEIPIDELQVPDLVDYFRGVIANAGGTPVVISLDSRIVSRLVDYVDRANDTICGLVAHACQDGTELNSFGIRDLANGMRWLADEEIVMLKIDAGRLLKGEWMP